MMKVHQLDKVYLVTTVPWKSWNFSISFSRLFERPCNSFGTL